MDAGQPRLDCTCWPTQELGLVAGLIVVGVPPTRLQFLLVCIRARFIVDWVEFGLSACHFAFEMGLVAGGQVAAFTSMCP